jgi:NhaP-type Na+/H+ and K+/H+ antiporter
VLVVFVVARPVAVFTALAGTSVSLATRAFMAWFGPKGVATMTFSLLVLNANIRQGPRIFNLAALVVFASIIAHGLTDTPGVGWIARRSGEDSAAPVGVHDPAEDDRHEDKRDEAADQGPEHGVETI